MIENSITEGTRLIVRDINDEMESAFIDYSMSVITQRALPDVRDGLKPVHRRILYTMHERGNDPSHPTRKSADTVGAVLGSYHPHGDASVYDAMVRLAQDFSMRYPLVDGQGNFGSVDGDPPAAYRYTEARMSRLAVELLRDIDKDTVDFVPNFDESKQEPSVLPCRVPNLLVNGSTGIAVGMASSICSFNLAELCETTIALLKDPQHDIKATMPAPDFVGGGYILYNEKEIDNIYETGRGSVRVRAKYDYQRDGNMLEIRQIPPTTTVEAVMDKIAELVKAGRVKEISDMRDETDLNGLKLTIDLKRGQDPDRVMQKLFRLTPLEDSFSCNFNVLIAGMPRVMGVREILAEWAAFRTECVRRRTYFELAGKEKRLHLLQGLAAILLDIDKAVRIVREAEVVPNLMIGFGIDQVQAEYVAEIKLRHLNREYILKRTQEIQELENAIAELRGILASPAKIKKIIMAELAAVAKQYGEARRSEILYEAPQHEEEEEEDAMPDYPVTVFYTREGYFKKITPLSLRMSGEQKLKEGDEVVRTIETKNNAQLLFFTSAQQVYKCRVGDFADGKASVMGEYVPARLGMDAGERPVYMALTEAYAGHMLFLFENGKCAKVPMQSYATKQNRKKLINAYSDKAKLVWAAYLHEEAELAVTTSAGRMLLVHSAQIPEKQTKNTAGVNVLTLKKNQHITGVRLAAGLELADAHRYRVRTLPAMGALVRAEDAVEQTSLL